MTCNSLWKPRQTKSQLLSIMLTMPRLLEKSDHRKGAARWTAARLSGFFGSRAGQQQELSARDRQVGQWAQPCWGQTGIACRARVPRCPVAAGSLLDTAARCSWLSLNTCNHEDLTIRLHLKHSLHPLSFCYSKLLATCNRVMYLKTF